MANKKSGGSFGGFVFNVFNIGFTVFMFILPTIGLAYWYLYIRDPGDGVAPQQKVVVEQVPVTPKKRVDPEPEPLGKFTPEPAMTAGFFDEPFESSPETSDRVSRPEPKVDPSVRKEYESRRWTDQSGEFSVQARFYSVIGDRVKIVTEDDRPIEVPIAKLSDQDKQYLRSVFREKGMQPSF